MHYILPLMFALFFTACNPTTIKDSPAPTVLASVTTATPLPVSHQETDTNDLKVIPEDSLVGNYVLKRGLFRNQEIQEGYLIIEEINVDNYGYYYVTITEGFTPETHTGIFYKKGGHYVQKVIEDSTEAEIRQGKKKSKMSIIDNMYIKQKGELLTLHINSNKKEKLLWIRDIDNVEKSEKMKKSLADSKNEYVAYYKDKCVDCEEFCGDSEYTKVNE